MNNRSNFGPIAFYFHRRRASPNLNPRGGESRYWMYYAELQVNSGLPSDLPKIFSENRDANWSDDDVSVEQIGWNVA